MSTQPFWLGWRHCIALVVAVIAVVVTLSNYRPQLKRSDVGSNCLFDMRNLSTISLETLHWSDSVSINGLVEMRVPKVVVNSVAMTWKALQWNLITLAESYPFLQDVLLVYKTKDRAVFVTQNEIHIGGMLHMVDDSHVEVV